ncbi:hypothetical protein L6164_031010 [Bauhinia variegata]|uniref:Uncharacterized protein n=1 Tax=Bauhinia variegata TaxID=167791 RepID=A0ACB9LF03_BAUVA|nr:hypothetical protein L6164_031010 [Bauhinia variegata]
MDHNKSQKIAALNQIIKAHYLIKITQLLISLSLCSFIFTPSSLLAFICYFNSLPRQLFTHTIDKNCMFLFCNGLLVFVGIIRSFSGSSGDDEPSKNIEDGSQSEFSDVEANESVLEKEAEVKTMESDEQNAATEQAMEFKSLEEEEKEEDDEDIGKAIVEYEDQSEENSESISNEEEEEPDGRSAEESRESETDERLIEENIQEDEVEEEEEEENWTVSTEEMNKKFDDFIRRMKEDLRIEARRQLVMV